MGYIPLRSNLNAIIGITSYYCAILKMLEKKNIAWCNKNNSNSELKKTKTNSEKKILHDATKTIQNRVFVFFSKKEQKSVFLKKRKKSKKPMWILFLNPGFFNPDYYLSIIFCDFPAQSDYLSIIFCDFPARSSSHNLEQVMSLSGWLGVRQRCTGAGVSE